MTRDPAPPRSMRRDVTVAVACAAFALGMVGVSYAAVPLYELFCQVTGYGGTTQRAEANTTTLSDRSVTVRFDSNASPGVPWTFRPVEREVRVKLGETRQIAYRVRNDSDRTVTASATFNVSPPLAGVYFNKIQCFCFNEQTLKPGEEVDMPVVFFVDPDVATVPELKSLPAITLSYTFFPVEGPADVAGGAVTPTVGDAIPAPRGG
ncbi:cytochrome c oxidase assembly protein [Antarcticirhabdus aurantiaca]|uniref:Cytochrome c oxidase assembly protein n=1 Tax=Antarcticirhabdus aurantiaca TaxID=2606717 RepID=A0ACD4NQR6_9HYPH|nr:cytochrome c oxidase assembly protein [Antarcticirhabdus aurantiaca]WAJ29118.1 cytochrome c oxidase assembly protein [Jeongeuplla avenae]